MEDWNHVIPAKLKRVSYLDKIRCMHTNLDLLITSHNICNAWLESVFLGGYFFVIALLHLPMHHIFRFSTFLLLFVNHLVLFSCADPSSNQRHVSYGTKGQLLASHPSVAERDQAIRNEPSGDYFVGRRYFVKSTTFWGYLRKPQQAWSTAQLVILNESSLYSPDRLPEFGDGKTHGYDQNFEYRIRGYYTGSKVYDPNSNQFYPEFLLQNCELLSKNPGWLFSPSDRYNPKAITLRP
jgi:hypothetical protein